MPLRGADEAVRSLIQAMNLLMGDLAGKRNRHAKSSGQLFQLADICRLALPGHYQMGRQAFVHMIHGPDKHRYSLAGDDSAREEYSKHIRQSV
ncbi:hypothetical protein D3C76_1266080 [compost metagenome]